MKKTCLLSILLIGFLTICLSGCGSSDSVYWEDWFDTVGYVEKSAVINERTGETDSSSKFISGPHPEGVSIAVRHEHKYTKSLSCTFKVKKLTNDIANDIVNELVEDTTKTKRFSIPRNANFEKIEGFIFYCDDEYVYVVNNLYDKYVEHTNVYTNPQYRFEISINGIQRLTIDMDLKQNSLPY